MENGKVMQWLDGLIEANSFLTDNESFNDGVSMCFTPSSIHFYKGIEKVAEALDVPLHKEKFNYHGYYYRYSFVYRDTEFFQIGDSSQKGACL